MKRTGFKRKATKPMKRTPLRSKSKNPAKKKKIKKKGYRVPPWFSSLPAGSHGSGRVQKKYWKVVSDYVRKRDFEKYDGRCVSCSKRLEHWKDGHAAHFRKYSLCNSWFKFDIDNIALSCPICNKRDDGPIGFAFGQELIRRYGPHHLEWIEKENLKYKGVKMEDWEIVEKVAELAPHLVVHK